MYNRFLGRGSVARGLALLGMWAHCFPAFSNLVSGEAGFDDDPRRRFLSLRVLN